jgi:cytochrome P450
VTGTVLGFLFTNLARSPLLQDRLLAEAKAAGEDQAYYFTRQDTLLHYTTLESLRVSPSVHFSLPELTGADKKIDGFAVPAGTPVIVDIRRLNTDSALWAPDPETFRPDRFAKMSAASYRHGMLRFGVGTGRCLGRHLADRILKMATVQVLKTFELRESSVANGEGGGKGGFTIGHESKIELVKREL